MPKLPKYKQKQTGTERGRAASGRISAITTKAGEKPLSMAAYRSFTDKQRADAMIQAGKDLRAGNITQKEFDAIERKIDAADAAQAQKSSTKGANTKAGNKKVKPLPNPFADMNKGGYGTKKKNMYSKGGMANAGASVGGTQKWTAG
tara:strand:- start:44 stop:484 length:441 start_codon:yes stop_codon:yes gene_type:complete